MAALRAIVASVVGCGKSTPPQSAAPTKQQMRKALAGSPPALTALHAKAGRLIGGSKADFDAQMKRLRGHPVVVNKWATWCPPCRGEFPVFQRVSVALGRRIAFLGLDAQDHDGDARGFLAKYPVAYPSYRDPELKISTTIQAGIASPTTVFFDRDGKLVYAHAGPYGSDRELIADIRRYAVRSN
jgi:cytochrome c biogenesis protein CcmG/thiol:disulfide interchange protein DsbE